MDAIHLEIFQIAHLLASLLRAITEVLVRHLRGARKPPGGGVDVSFPFEKW